MAGVLFCAPVWAFDRDKSDVVVLRNGDRITGNVVSLRYGLLTVETNNIGTVSIEWTAVRAISSKYAFGVERIGGVNYYGSVRTTEDGKALLVGNGESAATIPIEEVERVSQYSPGFWNRLNGSLAVGFSYTRASSVSVGSVNFDTKYRSTSTESSLVFSFNTTRTPTEGQTDRYVLSSDVMFLRQSRNFWSALGYFERDPTLGIEARVAAGAGIGRRLYQTPFTEVTGQVGLVGNQEWATEGGSSRTTAEGFVGADWRVFKFVVPKTTLDLNLTLLPSLSESPRHRVTGNLNLTHKFPGDLTIGVTGYLSYDSRPPEGAVEKSDYGATLSVGYVFGR